MKYMGDEDAKMIDIDPETETASILTKGETCTGVELSTIGTDVSVEFERLHLIHNCLSTIEGTIKPTDGEEGSLLEKVRQAIIEWQ